MIKILFICHGSICRSPMAEMIFKNIIRNDNNEDMFEVNSMATSTEEIGNDIYPPAKNILEKNNIPYEKHIAKQVKIKDYEYYDYVICMDQSNVRNLMRIVGSDYEFKTYKLLEFTSYGYTDIDDPWYTNNYQEVFDQIKLGCEELYKKIMSEEK